MKIFVLLPIIIGASLSLCSRDLKAAPQNYQDPRAIAGPDKTIYLTQTSTATLDGSASSGDSYQWTEISTDYISGATITSPNSKVTTVIGLPQGVFYFSLTASSGGVTKRDSMKVIVDYAQLHNNSSYVVGVPINKPDFKTMVNKRDDNSHYLTYNQSYRDYWYYGFTPSNGSGGYLYLERDRSNGMMIDSMNGKFYTTIENGYGGATAPNGTRYARSQVNLADFIIDSSKTYIVDWKFYFPQSVAANWDPSAPDWARVTMWDIHGDDDLSGQFGIVLAKDSVCYSDGIFNDNHTSMPYAVGKIISTNDLLNKTNTIRITYREGSKYPGQKAFIKIEVNGVLKYFRNVGQVGKTLMRDYMKVTGLYDYSNRLVTPNDPSVKRFSLVSEDASVYVIANTPTVNAGDDQNISSNSTSLSGTANDDGVSGHGVITSYQWSKLSGGSVTIKSPTSAFTTVSGLTSGTYKFQLKATDNSGIDGFDTVQVLVNNISIAGPEITVSDAKTITSDFTVVKGTVTWAGGHGGTFYWSQVSGPGIAFIQSYLSAQTYVKNLIPGTYVFRCSVNQDDGQITYADATVIVIQQNIPPTAGAGNNQTITLPTNSVNLIGRGLDEDGTITSYQWAKISGPNSGTINNSNAASANVTGLTVGTYQYELTVTDNQGLTGKDTVQVTVNEAANMPPTANAGNNQTITLPVNSVTLSGSGKDDDGNISSYQWSKISGPNSGAINNANSESATAIDLSEGLYQFELAVTDNKGAVAKDTMQVIVNEAINIAPTADAGTDQSITLPTNNTILYGSGNDVDGTIAAYSWAKISGPSNSSVEKPSSSFTNVSVLSEGIYQFELTVTDDKGATGKDTVEIIINPAGNIAPTAYAGADQSITLPNDNTILYGSGNDVDGTIAAYSWSKISGPSGSSIENSSSAITNVIGLSEGVYQFELTVTDDKGAIGKDTVQVTVNLIKNISPTADAGSDQNIILPTNDVTLSGSGMDVDGTIAGYSWAKISGPGSEAINNAGSSFATVTGLVQGVYQFELTAIDNNGAIGKDLVEITVSAPNNIAPTADAGLNQIITLPTNEVTLSGRGNDADGTIVGYLWTKISGPGSGTINTSNSSFATVTGLVQGIYQFELAATDNEGSVGKDTVQITVNPAANIPPGADAGINQTITLPASSVILSGSGSDVDGTIASYKWINISGPSGFSIKNSSSAISTVRRLVVGTYEFELTVTDDKGATGKDTVEIIVTPSGNIAPTADAGAGQSINLPTNNTILYGSGNDADGTIVDYSWVKISGPLESSIENSSSSFTNVSGLSEGIYQFELTVTDDNGATGKDTVQVNVIQPENIAPVADAGADQTITLPTNGIILYGAGNDAGGIISGYSWAKISGPSEGSIENPSSDITNVTGLSEGSYQFELTITDDKGAIGKDTVAVIVNAAINLAPTADAGIKQSITLPTNNTILYGTGNDADGTIANYSWVKISGPSEGLIENPLARFTNVSGLSEGVYEFELTVTDNSGAPGKDTVEITINRAQNIAPTADAGTNQTITLPVNNVILSGSGSDEDGTIAEYSWAQISGPGSEAINNADFYSASVAGLVQGVYQFELTVTDNEGAIAKDTVMVTVNPAENIAPIANAGINQTITLPVNIATLPGNGNDADGTIAGYLWTKISGPDSEAINNSNSSSTTITDLVQGVYQFELAVTDDKGAVGKDTVEVKVNAANNIAPTANAGVNQTVTLPTNSVTLTGSGNDVDGTVAGYSWAKISGPSDGTIQNPSLSSTDISGLSEGIYQFELTVTDDKGDVGKDTVEITVNSTINIAPTADAGINQTIKLPTNNITLSGKGSDTDGTVSSYLWTKISGPSGSSIVNAASSVTDVRGLKKGVYEFELTITDNKGAIGKDVVEITVNPADNIAPVANGGSNQSITLPKNGVILFGSGSDADGKISVYSWTKISGPESGTIIYPNSAFTIITGLDQGDYQFELAVTDNDGSVGKDTVEVIVNAAKNIAPTVQVEDNQTITLPINSITLSGTGNDVDGTIASYLWTKISGPSEYAIDNPSSSFTNASALSEGVYQFELTVTDDKGATAKDTVEITVNPALNIAPVANAGADQTITLPRNGIILLGSGSDVDGTIAGYSWKKISGPGSEAINNADSAFTVVTGLTEGVYQFELTVTDDKGAIGKDTVSITVNPAINIAPTADAGLNETITLPANSVILSGSGNDIDGTVTSYSWSKISGPVQGAIANFSSPSTTVSGLVYGDYQFELTVTDNKGATAKDTVGVFVNPAKNIAPTANAGADQEITLPASSILLTGRGNDVDGSVASYSWRKIDGPSSGTINNSQAASASITDLTAGVYQFELTVTDDKGAVGKDTVKITVNPPVNIAPTAVAGNNQTITLPMNSVILSGSGADVDGTIASYKWSNISGPSGFSLDNSSSDISIVKNLVLGTYEFELTVTDNDGATGKDTVEITVNPAENIAPTAHAGTDQAIILPRNGVILFGSGNDPDGSISAYLWTKVSGPGSETINNSDSAFTVVNGLIQGVYKFELTVTDNKGAIGKDTVEVTVNPAKNIPPVAVAGANQTITLPTNGVILFGNGSDVDGTVAGYSWTKISGPGSGTLNNADSAFTVVSGLTEGIYQFELAVIDDKGAVEKDTVSITVNPAKNIPPAANSGANQTITLPKNTINLFGSGTDVDGTIASYEWSKISGPSNFYLNNSTSAIVTVTALVQGTYEFELTVTDNKGATGKDTVEITVNPAINIAPIANAGINQTITLPINNITLSGSGSDVDGTVAGYLWTKISGPVSETINNGNFASASVAGLVQGVYQFELTVTDNKGAIGKDTVEITVNPAINIAPIANAGINQTITLPINNITLSGSGSDVDGTVAGYKWTKISGPSAFSLNNSSSAIAPVSGLVQGVYQFELTVTDNKGAIGKDTVEITVNPAINIAPIANAGINQTITLPINNITLSGSGSDVDGTVAGYLWTKISGPVSETINNANSASASVPGLVQGTYEFELTVTDNKRATGKDTVVVRVNEANNVAPIASAGTDKTITLPVNSVNLSGSGSDADGTIASYKWTKISGPSAFSFNNSSSAIATVSGLIQGNYEFELTATDNKGATGKDTVAVKVNEANNVAPTANAGTDKTITLPVNSVTLSGSGSDADGTIASYKWTKISGPSAFSFNNSSSAIATVSGLVPGTYEFELTVTDNKGAIGKDTVAVKVNEANNIAPTANAGTDKTITLPSNSVTLSGSGSDADGTIASYSWIKKSGPSDFNLNNSSSATALASGLVEGNYEFELTVTDNKGAIGKSTLQIIVNPAHNIAPIAKAGTDQTITLPVNDVTISGSGQDTDGNIASYKWVKISGPGSETINNPNSSSTIVSGLVQATYQFELTVTDNKGAIGRDTVLITVNAAGNIAPTANAGKDTTILSPASAVTLKGTAADSDGEIADYSWKQISGPSQSIILLGNTQTPDISALTEGTYAFELTATDDKGAIGKDTVNVTVALARLAPQINDTIRVYPNPVHDFTTADINTGRPNTHILLTITDMSGKIVYKKQFVSQTDNVKEVINMTNFSKGTYVITIFFDNVLRKSIKVLKL